MEALDASDPQRVGPYTLFARLGSGGMGKVYLGRSAGGRTVAVKVVRPELADDATFRSRFGHEVAAARAVSGAFTAPVVDADPDGPVPWMATSFVPGVSLAQAVGNRGPLPEATLRTLTAGIAEALLSIHAAGLIHRDLKPGNVLLAADGPHVIDFGITRAAESTALTSAGTVIGSPGFMSPEQALGTGVTPASDVFSLGATIAYAASGRGPFGEGGTPALMFRVVNTDPDLTGIPAFLLDPIRACFAKEPHQRPTPRQLVDYIDQNSQSSSGSWLPPAVIQDVVAAQAVVTGLPVPVSDGLGQAGGFGGQPQWQQHSGAATLQSGAGQQHTSPLAGAQGSGPSRRNILLAAGAGVIVVGGGGAAAFALTGGDKKKTPTTPVANGTSATPSGAAPQTAAASSSAPTDAASSQAPAALGPATGAKGTLDGPAAKQAWQITADNPVYQVATLGQSTLLISGNDATGVDTAVQVKFGPLSVGGLSGNSNQVTTANNLYYIPGASQDGSGFGLYAIDPAAGSVKWHVLTPTNGWQPSGVYGLLGTTAIVGGSTLDGPGKDAFIWAVDTSTQKSLWTLTGTQSGAVFVPPSGTKIVVGQNTSPDAPGETAQVTVYDITSKSFGWKKAVANTANFTSPGNDPFTWAGGLLVWAASTVTAVDPATGTQKWSYKAKDFQTFSPPAASPDGKLVFSIDYDTLYAIDASNGQLKWKTQAPGKGFGFALEATAIRVADGNVYCWDADYTLWAVDAASGTTRWKMPFPNASGGSDMAVACGNGRVVVAVGKSVTAINASGR